MKKKRTKKKSHRLLWTLFWLFVVIPLTIVAGLALLNWVVMPLVTGHGEETPVPDLVGLARVEALERITAAGLKPGETRVVSDDSAPPDHVVAQRPQPGRMVKPGRLVDIDVSRGAGHVLVPDVERVTLDEAIGRLEAAGLLVLEIESLRTPNLPPGQVIAVRPPSGTEVVIGSPVTVAVSAPVGSFPMPNLLGVNYETASGIIASQGLVVGTVKEAPSDEPAGIVMVQYPEEGMSVRDGDSVHLIVSVPTAPSDSQ